MTTNSFVKIATALAVVAYSLTGAARAADLNARDFVSAPPGTSIGVLYLDNEHADTYHGKADTSGKADLNVDALTFRQLWFSDICGTLCTPQFVVPLVDVRARLPGASDEQEVRGFGDPQVGGTLYVINDPERRVYSGLLTMLSLPLGKYDPDRPGVSPGDNRWAAHLVYNYTRGLGERWLVEANLEAQLYADNDDYLGGTLEQDPLYRLQAFASYDITPRTYGSLRLIHAEGGALTLDGERLDDTRQRYTQLGLGVGHHFTARDLGLLTVSRNVDTENGYHGSQVRLRLSHVW
ncbi:MULTISPECIES: transporter [Modicisalibacter]|uniref:transporter n=1 Tax=Modicisalibacter TaxID=574347 RepID=UPI00100A45BE|nr:MULTISPECIES: transporter [Halomonadaceae]MBZ9557491.1 transporter [Modicisalibacter sp. R2A 31.J]MBZ9573843.1 transporter [Modicisalibacter sp. MOD 31.J]